MKRIFNTLGRCALAIGLLAGCVGAPLWAATITVTSTADTGAGSLRQALLDAAAGDTIDFNLVYPALIYPQTTLYISKNVMIAGPGAANLILDGNNAGYPMIQFPVAATATISGLTMQHAGASAIHLPQGTLTVNQCAFLNNLGSAIISSGSLTVNDSVFTDNASGNLGGAIYSNAAASINRSSFMGNTASSGGGAIVTFGGMGIHYCTFSGNQTLGNNSSRGGAISAGGTLLIDTSTFNANTARGFGGAIHNEGTLTLTGSTLAGNVSLLAGNGINTFSSLTISRSILDGCNGTVTSAGDNIGNDGSCVTTSAILNDRANLDALLVGLANNGGPTKTMALQTASPAIDQVTINTAACTGTDQRGVTRPAGLRCDTGAVEMVSDTLFRNDFE